MLQCWSKTLSRKARTQGSILHFTVDISFSSRSSYLWVMLPKELTCWILCTRLRCLHESPPLAAPFWGHHHHSRVIKSQFWGNTSLIIPNTSYFL